MPVEPPMLDQEKPIAPPKVTQQQAAVDCANVIAEIESLRNSKVITLFAKETVSIAADVCDVLYDQLKAVGKVDRIDLFLNSVGGATEVPWRIVTLLRSFCKHLGVLIPRKALSAATQLALGANEIVMGNGSELSPVDPSRTHPLLPKDEQGRSLAISVQDLRHCIEFVKKGGASTESEAKAGPTIYESADLASIYTALFQYIHPLALGAIEQSYALAKLITRKLLSTHMEDEKKIEEIADRLSDDFKSHHYLIGWKEAKDGLDLKVTYDDSTLMDKMISLYEIYVKQTGLGRSLKQVQKAALPEVMERPILWIDTTFKRHLLLEVFTLETQKGGLSVEKILGTKWAKVDVK